MLVGKDDVQLLIELGGGAVVWAFTAGVIWTKLNNKIDNNYREAEEKATNAEQVARDEAARVAAEAESDRQAIRAEADRKHEGLRGQINGLGERLNGTIQSCSSLGGRMEAAERQLGIVQQQNTEVTSRLGRVEARVDAVDGHMTEFKLELFQHIGDLKTLISSENSSTRQMLHDRDANLRERLARVEQKNNIPHADQ